MGHYLESTADLNQWVCEVKSAIGRCDTIFATGIFAVENNRHPLFLAAVTDLLVNLGDLAHKSKGTERAPVLTEHVRGAPDLVQLIIDCRDAASHVRTWKHLFDDDFNRLVAFIDAGEGMASVFNGVVVHNMFKDDVTVAWGKSQLYIWRNAKAFLEAMRTVFADEIAFPAGPLMARCKELRKLESEGH